jgi:hypothetical protein
LRARNTEQCVKGQEIKIWIEETRTKTETEREVRGEINGETRKYKDKELRRNHKNKEPRDEETK